MAGEAADRLIPCARAKFDFSAKSEVELSFSAGVSLRLLRRIDENWLEGELEGRVGIFPASFVDIELSIPSRTRESELAKSGRPYAIGLYDFSGDCEGDLRFTKGELIELLGSVGSGWLRGRTGKREGIFPASFVDILKLPVAFSSESSSSPSLTSPLFPGSLPEDRRSPEYAIPGEMVPPGGGREMTEVGVREEERLEGVFENGFSDEEGDSETESQSVPTPRLKHKSKSLSSGVGGGESEGGRHTPSRTPPAPPRSTPPRRQVI